MRSGAALVAAQLLATSACASPFSEAAVSVLRDVCVSPASSEARLAAAEGRAKDEHWKLIRWARGPRPALHAKAEDSQQGMWELDLSGSHVLLFVSVLSPEPPDQRWTLCAILPEFSIDLDDLVQSVDRQFGPLMKKYISSGDRYTAHYATWVFADEEARGNCGRAISVGQLDSRQRGIEFRDFVIPDGDRWQSARALLTPCPEQ
jgi:hypothetical protein